MFRIIIIILISVSANANQIKSKTLEVQYQDQEQLDRLQKEVQSLNAKYEELQHIVSELKKRIDNPASEEELRSQDAPKIETPEVTEQPSEGKAEESKLNPVSKGSEKQVYDLALAALKSNDYKGAGKKFEEFLLSFPKSPLLGNAHYWYGETFFKQKSYDKAALHYLKSYKLAPKGAKASEALLKLATSLQELKKFTDACGILNKLDNEFSNRTEASVKKAKLLRTQMKCK